MNKKKESVEQLYIPMEVQSRNKIDKMHWSDKSRLRQMYQLFIRQQMSKYRYEPAKEGEQHNIEIITYRKHPVGDYDNLIGGVKQLLDALVNENFIWDDRIKYIGKPDIRQEKGDNYTIIRRTKRG